MESQPLEASLDIQQTDKTHEVKVLTIPKRDMEEVKDIPPEGSIKVKMGRWEETDGHTLLSRDGNSEILDMNTLPKRYQEAVNKVQKKLNGK